jgi:hypothetical protein
MVDYRDVDWKQERPNAARFEAGWCNSQFIEVEGLDARLEAVLETLRYTHVNGGAQVAQFQFDVEPAIRWFITRNRLPEGGFFRKFFALDVVQRRMNIPPPVSTGDELGFRLENSFVATGRLAQTISMGGAYRSFEGSDAKVLELVNGFTEAAFNNRFSDVAAYLSWEAWSPWFKEIAWDATFFWLDKKSGTATVLVVTDTD